jgi:putative ABC transport system substrate-binding protein
MMTYEPASATHIARPVIYAGRLRKGEKAADLPVIRSSKFEFALNLGTTKALGIEIPPSCPR